MRQMRQNTNYRMYHIRRCYPPKLTHPPPTAQTDHGIDLKFGMVTHLVHTFGVIEAIFEFPPLSRDIGGKPPGGENGPPL